MEKKLNKSFDADITADGWLHIIPKTQVAQYAITKWFEENNTEKKLKIVIERSSS